MCKRILLLNSKGGCGKTTLATNLAAYYAAHDMPTTIIDYDTQSSSIQWLKQRPEQLQGITGIEAHQVKTGVTRSWALRVPEHTQRVIIDTPAGFSRLDLLVQARKANLILVPVLPSPIDIRAFGHFVKTLYFDPVVRQKARIGVVANRVRHGTLVFNALEHFLKQINIPFVATLRDSQLYIKAANLGIGIHEYPAQNKTKIMQDWQTLIHWLENDYPDEQEPDLHLPVKTLSL